MLPISRNGISIESEVEKKTNDPFGERMEELYKCEHCISNKPEGTAATKQITLMNISKYIVIQLKIFGYDNITGMRFKKNPMIRIEERFHSILLGNLNLRAVVYHVGDTIDQGHYMASVKHGDTWYECNDKSIVQGVNCHPTTIPEAIVTPYLLIYEKNNAEP